MLEESWVVVVVVIYTVIEIYLSLFIVEKVNHREQTDGFVIIAHDPKANDIFNNVKEILAKKNKEKIQVFYGPDGISSFDESEFEKECAENFKRCFETSIDEDPLRIPWKIPEKFERIINIMLQWCKETNKKSGTKGLVLHSFSILKLAYRHGFTKEMLQDYIKIGNYREAPIIVVYNPHESALLLLRKAENKKLASDIALAFNDLKLLILLFYDVLVKSDMKVIPLVVTDENIYANNLDCLSCMNLLLSEEDFADIGTFDDWWASRENAFGTEYKGKFNETLCKRFLAKLTGVLSAALVYPSCIPKFTEERNIHQHMEYLKVLLTQEQLNIYYSEQKHMIIRGGFGCGKSIIANAMLQKISESLKEDEKLFYVCYDPRSELLNKMVKTNQEKVTPIDNKKGQKLSQIIDDITKEEGPGKINIVIDEYDGEDLDESEAERLNDFFGKVFKELFIVLIVQPIEKRRVINEIPETKNRFDILEKTMKTYSLERNMRNSVEIHKLIEATKEVLSATETIFTHPKDNEEKIKESVGVKSKGEFVPAQVPVSVQDPQEPESEIKRELKGQSEKNSSNLIMGLDEAQAIKGSPTVDNAGGNRTVSSFSYPKVPKTGHKIKTQNPVLFELGGMEEFHKHLSLLAIFEKILNIRNKHVVLHFNTEANLIPSALQYANENYLHKKITTNYEEFESLNKSILVCSYPTFRGLSHPIITILIDQDIYYLQHFLVEMLARCTSELFIVVLQNSSALESVTNAWKGKKLVTNCEIKISDNPTQRDILDPDYSKYPDVIDAKFKSESETYKELEKAFKILTMKNKTITTNREQKAKEMIDKNR